VLRHVGDVGVLGERPELPRAGHRSRLVPEDGVVVPEPLEGRIGIAHPKIHVGEVDLCRLGRDCGIAMTVSPHASCAALT